MIDGRYTEAELLKVFSDNGWSRLQFKLVDQGSDMLPEGGTISHWLYRAMQPPLGGCLTTRNFVVLKWPDGTYLFDGRNPFEEKQTLELDQFKVEVASYVASRGITVTQQGIVDSVNERATMTVIDKAEEKKVLIQHGVDGKLEMVDLI